MAQLYLYIFIAICGCMIAWGLIKPTRIYECPFFMGGIFATFIGPQAISLINTEGSVSQYALEAVLLMSCLCVGMCWVGYKLPLNYGFIKKLEISVNPKKFLHGGILFVLISYLMTFLILRLPPEVLANTQWTGIATIYIFFGSLGIPGFVIILLSMIRRPTFTNIALTAFAAYPLLTSIILLGRREVTVSFLAAIGLALFYTRRYVPPKWLILSLLIFSLIAVPITGLYRGYAKSGEWDKISQLKPIEILQNYINKGENLELRNAAYIIEYSSKNDSYSYGADYWNTLVFSFVPGQWVGKEIKSSMMFSSTLTEFTESDYKTTTGVTITGVGDSFAQFGYFGSIFFALLAVLFKHIWISAVYRNNLVMQVVYAGLLAPGLLSITHGSTRFPSNLFYYFVFIGAVVLYARQKPLPKSSIAILVESPTAKD